MPILNYNKLLWCMVIHGLMLGIVTTKHFEDSNYCSCYSWPYKFFITGAYDILCLEYSSADTDICSTCGYLSGQSSLATWYTSWGQDCRKSATDGSCIEGTGTATTGQTTTSFTFCAPQASVPSGSNTQGRYFCNFQI